MDAECTKGSSSRRYEVNPGDRGDCNGPLGQKIISCLSAPLFSMFWLAVDGDPEFVTQDSIRHAHFPVLQKSLPIVKTTNCYFTP